MIFERSTLAVLMLNSEICTLALMRIFLKVSTGSLEKGKLICITPYKIMISNVPLPLWSPEMYWPLNSKLKRATSLCWVSTRKYKGCALLQKTYTPDFLKKKAVKNDGSVPQYYVEDSHPAIIDPDQFQLVQDIFKERASDPKHSGATIFSGKIRCGCCGGWYGSKVWHSNDKYRRVVWQCNSKFKDKTRCKTPHLTEDEVKAAFIRLVNKLSTDREFYVTELTAIKDRLGDTTALEKEHRILDEQLGIDAKAVNDLIAQNARVAQNQTEYNERYDALVSRYEETERRRNEMADRINQIMVRRRKLERFIETVKALPELYTEFDAGQWAALVDSMTVHAKDRITFTLTCGMVIEA